MDVNNKYVFCIFSDNRRQHNESHNLGLYLMGSVWVCGICVGLEDITCKFDTDQTKGYAVPNNSPTKQRPS